MAVTSTDLITRKDLDAGLVDFGDSRTGERLPPVHPGDILKFDFIEQLGLTPHALALALHVPANRIGAILAGQRGITAGTALRLARFFGTSVEFWLNLQQHYELDVARRAAGARIEAEVAPRALAGAE